MNEMEFSSIQANTLMDGSMMVTLIVTEDSVTCLRGVLSEVQANISKYCFSLSKRIKPKSNDANSYMWILCDKIAKKIGKTTKEDVYRSAIREVGMFEDVPIKNEEVDKKILLWESIGVGWVAEEMRDSKINGYTLVRRYFGSRLYDNYNMCHLVDFIVDAAAAQGVDTRTPNEIAKMKALWGAE